MGKKMVHVIGGVPVRLTAIYAAAAPAPSPTRISFAMNLDRRLAELQDGNWNRLEMRHAAWVVDPNIARRVVAEAHRLLDVAGKRVLPGQDWFNIAPDWAWRTIRVAAETCGVPILTTERAAELLQSKEDLAFQRIVQRSGISIPP